MGASEGVGVVERITRQQLEMHDRWPVAVLGDRVDPSEYRVLLIGGDNDRADGDLVGLARSLSDANGIANSPSCCGSHGMSISIELADMITSSAA